MADNPDKFRSPTAADRSGVTSRDLVPDDAVRIPSLPAANGGERTFPPSIGQRVDIPKTNRGYLPGTPLAVLLPTFGDASRLTGVKDALMQRLKDLRETPGDLEDPKDQVSEEAMLSQVLQWITVEEE